MLVFKEFFCIWLGVLWLVMLDVINTFLMLFCKGEIFTKVILKRIMMRFVVGQNLLIFMNFLFWFIPVMLIVIAWPRLLFDLSVLVFHISTMWLFINALILSVVRIILIVVVGVGVRVRV